MTTQVTGTYADIYRWDNLYMAYRRAAKGKRGEVSVAVFEYGLETNAPQLNDDLAAEHTADVTIKSAAACIHDPGHFPAPADVL